jgi:PAS domain S-box-containing protein
LAELCGFSLSAQTTFATAVSEIARCAISFGKNSCLFLGINSPRINKKEISALLRDAVDLSAANSDAISYAKRLMGDLNMSVNNGMYEIKINHAIPFSGTFTNAKIEGFKDYFKNEPPISPYDEIRKKNIQLIELADKLKQSENQYRTLTDTLPLLMFSINRAGEIIYSNKGLIDFMGPAGTKAATVQWQSLVHPEDYKKLWADWDRCVLNHTVFRGQGRLKQKGTDNYTWHLISIVPIKNEDNIVKTWIGFFVDIHAQKLVEETLKDNKELKEAKKELEQYQQQLEQKINELNMSNHELEQFAYIASHDLQEPLRKIKTFSLLLKKEIPFDEKGDFYFEKIVSSSDRMSALIKDVLNYSRLSNKNEKFVETDLNSVLDNVKTDFELFIKEKNAVIHSTPLPVIKGIPLQLTQLFANIINNSIKFSEQSPLIKISASLAEGAALEYLPQLDTAKKYHRITFNDNGIGFEQQYAAQIFTIFQRLNDRHSYEGTGIGLALCKKIVENHHGAIKAESEPDKGATFLVYLPVL